MSLDRSADGGTIVEQFLLFYTVTYGAWLRTAIGICIIVYRRCFLHPRRGAYLIDEEFVDRPQKQHHA